MTALTTRNVALTDQILAALADEGGLPISTSALHARLSPPCGGWPHTDCWDRHLDYATIYRLLNRLAKRGEVEKIRLEDMRSRYWRRWVQEPPR